MVVLLTLLACVFSVYAGIAVARAGLEEGNARKTYVLLGAWSVMYAFFLLFIFSVKE